MAVAIEGRGLRQPDRHTAQHDFACSSPSNTGSLNNRKTSTLPQNSPYRLHTHDTFPQTHHRMNSAAHIRIYVVIEQISCATSAWNTSLCAFDNLQSANAEARNHAIQNHARGNALEVQVYWRNGFGNWRTVQHTQRGRIVKSIRVAATTLHFPSLLNRVDLTNDLSENKTNSASNSPNPQGLRQIQAFGSVDSIRTDDQRDDYVSRNCDNESITPKQHSRLPRRVAFPEVGRILDDRYLASQTESSAAEENIPSDQRRNPPRLESCVDDLRDFASFARLF